jgi:hypothetical protein
MIFKDFLYKRTKCTKYIKLEGPLWFLKIFYKKEQSVQNVNI